MSASGPRAFFFNIYLAGDPKVGKKHLIQRMVEGQYSEILADDFAQGQMHVHKDIRLCFHFVPSEGISRVNALLYPKGMHAVLLVVDPCDKASVQNAEFWLNDTNRYIGDTAYKMLLIAKSDISEVEWQVKKSELGILASTLRLPAIEISAKNGEHIEFLISHMIDECKKYYGIAEMLPHFKLVNKKSKKTLAESSEEIMADRGICPEIIQILQTRYDKLALKFQDVNFDSLGTLDSLLSSKKESTKLSRFVALHMILTKARAINATGTNTLRMKISDVVSSIFIDLNENDKEAFRKSTSSISSGNFGRFKNSQFGKMMQKINQYYLEDLDPLGFEDFSRETISKKYYKLS
ncbi:hypothetical protein CC99x_002670 [Candidatus Berkiella cookevillensis]|uniref:Ras family protein n=1 Tax=Candidatus Berkiella cookevillensis TaxID=437022 RepID=A0A0Q9YPH6_9GAMM|nr:hypothetical protein [Candidatus Berkiella cookevillensis]MCS5707801.1 hypothetical protein [Candidatus Berkiella cookevillensis]